MPGRARAAVALGVLALAAGVPPGLGRRAAADAPEVAWADDLTAEERAAGEVALRATVRLATAPDGFTPPPTAVEASGLLVGRDGLVATSERFVRRVAARAGLTLWARVGAGPWEATRVVGGAWFARLGVVRLPTSGAPRPGVPFAPAPRRPRGRVVVAAAASGARVDVRAAPVASVTWVDPTADGGRLELRRTGADRTPGRGAGVIALRVAEAAVGRGLEGTPLFDADGGAVGLALAADPDRPAAESVRAVAGDVVAPWVDRIGTDGDFDPLDLGLTLVPAPVEPGAAVDVPRDLAALRATTAEKGGVLASALARASPCLGQVWAGEIVLEVAGHAVVGEVAESLALATAGLHDGVPADVVVWRGKREVVSVTPVRARTLYRPLRTELEVRAARLDR